MNSIYKLIIGGMLIGIVSFYGYRFYREKNISSDRKKNIRVLNNDVDLGLYKLTNPKHVYFKIVNDNDFDLKLVKILPDCDCYSVAANKKIIMPKDTLIVDAKYDANPGPFLKKVHLYFEDYNEPLVMFFKGKIIKN